MTNDKAKESFSAYFEGSLEPGLSVSFEQKLNGDAMLHNEYRSFVSTMRSLDTLKEDEIEVPADLHERISARLDKYIYDQKRKAPAWGGWLRNLAFAGIGAVAIAGTIIAINARGGEASSDLIGQPGRTNRTSTVDVKNLPKNTGPSAMLFEITKEGSVSYVAVPGTQRSPSVAGEGDLKEFAKAVADHFRMPVSLKVADPKDHVSWKFGSVDPVAEVSKALAPAKYQISLLESQSMLQIESHP